MVQTLFEDTTPEVGSEVTLATEGATPENPLSFGLTMSPTFSFVAPDTISAENIETGEQNYESTPIPSPSPTIIDVTPEENGTNNKQNCDANNFTTRGTQWLAADTGDAMLLKDHTYCCVPPWHPTPDTAPSPVAKQPATSTPQKSSAKPPLPSFDLDEDITDLTFSSVDGKDSSYQLSFEETEELDDTIEIPVTIKMKRKSLKKCVQSLNTFYLRMNSYIYLSNAPFVEKHSTKRQLYSCLKSA